MRTYYRIWNLAIAEGYCNKEYHPSKFIRFRAYKRIRTQKRSIKQEFLQRIIEAKSDPDCSEQSDAGYLFPTLNATHHSSREISLRIKAALRNFNDDLKLMASSVGWQRKFTSYSLRHSFATHLRNNKVDVSMIREALGHETEEQTVIYLDSLDDLLIAKEVDRALYFDKTSLGKNSQRSIGMLATIKEKLSHLLKSWDISSA